MSVWLVGTGDMAGAYVAAVRSLGIEPLVVGRTEATCRAFSETHGIEAIPDGLDTALATRAAPARAIVATPITTLSGIARSLIAAGTREILLEKPGAMSEHEASALAQLASDHNAKVWVAYNRRHYASVLRAREIIEADGGLLSCVFDFTEVEARILGHGIPPEILSNWFIANSTHVIDLVFFLAGEPREMSTCARNALSWHPASTFTGHGETLDGVAFAYHADWGSGGRWGIELCTSKRRLILRPIERLHQMLKGTFAIEEVPLDMELDAAFKPGLVRQCQAFFSGGDGKGLMSIEQQAARFRVYDAIRFGRTATT